ncbi:uncharacterized protein LOC132205613 isoform X2 [Neocloeon triangulifer]|nr:uncharacterized protein LOC132205613 isoform X2 [Neocloeon triangulifer]XP_059490790.1 uncharacterized protein LOC132205613 isoform X2 [Neocloeon triangulifer]
MPVIDPGWNNFGKPSYFNNPEDLREIGNKSFRSGDYRRAISAYTKSLARAPAGSELRGLAYANRSAVLLTLGYYEECISDAKIALENNYPENLAQKLQMRMAVAYKALGKEAEAKESLQVAVKLIKDRKLRPEVEEAVIESLRDELEDRHQKPTVSRVRVEYVEPPKLRCGPNQIDLNVSAALTVKDKVLIANRRINVGDVLIVEQPAIFEPCISDDSDHPFWIYCWECMKLCLNLKPCSACSWACYCSDECASVAWNIYHKSECAAKKKIMETLATDDSRQIFALNFLFKVISTFGLENCINAYLNSVGEISNETPMNLQKFLLLENCDMAVRFARLPFCMEAINLMAESLGTSSERKWALFRFLERALQIIFGNWHIAEDLRLFQAGDDFYFSYDNIGCMGFGIYHSVTSMKSSCDPNVSCAHYLKTIVVKAVRPIEAGEEITTLRGIHYSTQPVQMRRNWNSFNLSKQFVCHCQACNENWSPSFNQVLCHSFVARNPAYTANIEGQFKSKIMMTISNKPIAPISVFTPENLAICISIMELYGNKRRDDLQFNHAMKFARMYFGFVTRKFSLKAGVASKLHHYVPVKIREEHRQFL